MRTPTRQQGRVTVTPLEIRRAGAVYGGSSSPGGAGRLHQEFDYGPGDFTPDGGFYYIDVPHNIGSTAFIAQCIDPSTGETVLWERDDRISNLYSMRIWFSLEDPARYRRIIVL